MTKAVIYVRVSTDEQVKHGVSLDSQLKACQEFARNNNLQVVQVFREEGQSAKTIKRTQLLRLLAYCETNKGHISHVIIWKVDRFSRNTSHYLYLKSSLSKLGISVSSATQPIDDTSTGNFLEVLFAAVGQLENDIHKERVVTNMIERIKSGAWPFRAPLGYKTTRDILGRPTLKKNEDSHRVLAVFNYYFSNSPTLKELVNYARSIGLKNGNASVTNKYLFKMIRNPVYAGWVTSDLVDGMRYQGLHECILSPELFDEIQELLDGKKRNTRRSADDNWPLRGFITCAICDKPLTSSTPRGRSKQYPRYSCVHCRKSITMQKVSVPREQAHEEFKELISKLEFSSDDVAVFKRNVLKRWKIEIEESYKKQNKLDKDFGSLRDKRQKILDLFIDDKLTVQEKEDQLIIINNKLHEVELERTSLSDDSKDKQIQLEYALNFLSNLSKLWEDAEPILRIRLQRLLFPDGIKYDFIEGFRTNELWLVKAKETAKVGGEKGINEYMVVLGRLLQNQS